MIADRKRQESNEILGGRMSQERRTLQERITYPEKYIPGEKHIPRKKYVPREKHTYFPVMVQIRINEKPRRFSVYVELLGFAVFPGVAVDFMGVVVFSSLVVNLLGISVDFPKVAIAGLCSLKASRSA